MLFKKREKEIEALKSSFGKAKDDDFFFGKIERYFKHKDHSESYHILNDKTCHDLDIDYLFMFLDRTHSKVGQQVLYNQLRTFPADSTHIELDEKIIKELTENLELRIKTQKLLKKLEKDEVYYLCSLFQEAHIKPPNWFFAVHILAYTSLLSLLCIVLNPFFLLIFMGIFIINLVIHYWNKKNLYQYIGSIPQLLRLKAVANQLQKEELFAALNPNLNKALKVINQVGNRMSFFQLEANMQGDFQSLLWSLTELLKIAFLIEPILLFSVLKKLDTKRDEFEEVFTYVGKVDSLMSIANLRYGLDRYCTPQIHEAATSLSTSNIYHPLIDNCVTNSIDISNKSVLLTGSNMSGKTTFIRTIGINFITGLTINTCFADTMSISRAPIFSAIRISDDLMNDKSYYFEEVLTVKEMIDRSEKNSANLFLLDEIFKGTNTVERISAGKAVLSSLSKNNNIVFVSTHDIELTDMLSEEYDLYHFSELVDDKNVTFDYKLKTGRLKNRNAIKILKINGYPDEIIKEAIKISKKLDDSVKRKR